MDAITELRQRLIDWKGKLKQITVDVARNYEAEAVDLVTEEQLFEGMDNMGQPIRPKYTPFTVRIKRSKGQPTDRVTLKDTGDFYNSIKIRYGTGNTNHIMVFFATDEKVEKLEAKYGKELLGLNEGSLEEFNELIRDDLINAIQNNF